MGENSPSKRTGVDDLLFSAYQTFECRPCHNSNKLEEEWNFPNIFILGARKGGTTALQAYLGQHPDVFNVDKETHFFDSALKWMGKDHTDKCSVLSKYREHLLRINNNTYYPQDKLVLDKSPRYIMGSYEIPQRILCLFSQAKFIVLLRNPVDRAFSQYNMRKRLGTLTERNLVRSLEKEIAALEKSGLMNLTLSPKDEYTIWKSVQQNKRLRHEYIARGLYAVQLRQWIAVLRNHFGKEKLWDHLLILESERAIDDKQAYFDKVVKFANIRPIVLKNTSNVHVGRYTDMSVQERLLLTEFFRGPNKRLHELLSPFGIEISWAKADANNI